MQIDFHHATTYVAARLAGFEHKDADIIAHAAQYVDDAIVEGTIYFHNKALYHRISSAHKMLDRRNAKALANHRVWIPFHFLPGNAGINAGDNPNGKFINKIVCTPDSPVARDMVRQAIIDQNRLYGLHRLGIAMHVYADTWAHQNFAGVLHKINEVEDAEEIGDSSVFDSGLVGFIRDILDDAIPPLGHGRATIFPDMPFLSWQYKNGSKKKITRHNTDDFCQAANKLCMAMQRYIANNPDAEVSGIASKDMNKIQDLFSNTKLKEGEDRHQVWLTVIKEDPFSFGPETVTYKAKGKGSWKDQALGSSFDIDIYTYKKNFLTSNWKLFHDAALAHRFHVIHDLLPQYDICAA